jgi:hypothetical protein
MQTCGPTKARLRGSTLLTSGGVLYGGIDELRERSFVGIHPPSGSGAGRTPAGGRWRGGHLGGATNRVD